VSLTPNKIHEMFVSKKIDQKTTLNYFISFIENSENERDRLNCIKYFRNIDIETRQMYEFLENLLTSDENYEIRGQAGQIIILKYFEKAKRLINWAFDNITSIICLNYLIKGLSMVQDEDAFNMLVNLIYRYKEKPLINIVINAVCHRADDLNQVFNILLNEYWKPEKIEISRIGFQRDAMEVVINGDVWITYESDTLLHSPVKEAIEEAIKRIFLERELDNKLWAQKFLKQRDKKIEVVEHSDMLDSVSAITLKCLSLFHEKNKENLNLLLNQILFIKKRPYLNDNACTWIINFLIRNYLEENQDLELVYEFHDLVYNCPTFNNYILELYMNTIDKLLTIKPYSNGTFQRLVQLLTQYKAVNERKILKKIEVFKALLEENPSKIQLILENSIKKEYSLRVLHFLLTKIEEISNEIALRIFKLRMSRKYGVIEAESLSIFKINIQIQDIMISRGFKKDYPSYSTEKKHVTRLNLSSCQINTFPLEIINLKLLKELWLNDNKLKDLPKSILYLKHLNLLAVRNNPLKKIPEFLINTELQIIYV